MKPKIVPHKVGGLLLWRCYTKDNVVIARTMEGAYLVWKSMEKLHDSKK